MLQAFNSVRSILIAIFMLMSGVGFITSLIGVKLESAGFTAPEIGLIASCYYGGLILGALRFLPLIERVGHIRAFSAAVSALSVSTLAYSLGLNSGAWAILRLVDGFCLAGVYVCLESWLNERADGKARGTILASYMIALYLGQAVAQLFLGFADDPRLPFIVGSLLVSLSVLPIALTRLESPSLEMGTPLSARELYAASPLGLVGVGMNGMMLGAFYALGAVFVRRIGLELSQTALFMSLVILGGVALQWPVGWLSDRFDRRQVIVGSLALLAILSAGLAFVTSAGPILTVLGALFGGLAFAIYPLCVAHTNDHLGAEQRVGASGGLVMIYSIGAAAGPVAGSTSMAILGPGGLFAFIATVAAGVMLFGIWRQLRSDAVPYAEQEAFQVLPRTTAVSASLDPLGSEAEDDPQFDLDNRPGA